MYQGVVDTYEAQWYILHMCAIVISSVLSFIVGIIATVMATLCIQGRKYSAAISLKHYLSIEKTRYPIINSERFYTVSIKVGTGNYWCRFLKKIRVPVSLIVSGSVRWIPSNEPESKGRGSHVYPCVGRRVIEDTPNFCLTPNTTIELAVAKSLPSDSDVYILGGYSSNISFIGTYNLNLDIFTIDRQQLCRLTIDKYIQDSKFEGE